MVGETQLSNILTGESNGTVNLSEKSTLDIEWSFLRGSVCVDLKCNRFFFRVEKGGRGLSRHISLYMSYFKQPAGFSFSRRNGEFELQDLCLKCKTKHTIRAFEIVLGS